MRYSVSQSTIRVIVRDRNGYGMGNETGIRTG
ncbi:hypothetical protein immuto35A_120 [Flavobacterium phage vB_FspM_immuto_3-5A]|uniref:Uncharacterized protein n=1 Tax=Flavobacterium phage vB_FspM_immuto_2-6A TaxID=2801477 RepID=A0A7T8IWM3_9CAUD|nr:hypothetical protein KNV73_gp150 [Flavobacterium phage vB_FspM_immuto_2-6A]QQO91800.1 hypothetical protein immuto26A_121 [Flavobacterium phage vB_FspM_immuto_2-6A]QQO92038.1 hypothetical protein immuto35A_120 [Flavobacterium phage vB_FspM_immuto_3-5A]QQO92276.1 hypothetical protein immuto136C_120 [Flavobacterium phage vB_FspM_immuto_13-6C]